MPHVLDHVFACTARHAPAAALLIEAGLQEGAPNRHPGQGTACRRFFFSNAMLELLWLEDEAEARSELTRPTRLWERLSGIDSASPFGIILRPASGSEPVCPWLRSWNYQPAAMPGLELEIAADTDLEEPMWCFFKAGRAPAEWPVARRQPTSHPAGFGEITRLSVGLPRLKEGSVTGAMADARFLTLETGTPHKLEIEFDNRRQGLTIDFLPHLPIIFHA